MFVSQVVEDPLQSQRLKYAFESEKGLLGKSLFVGVIFTVMLTAGTAESKTIV